MFCLGIEGTAHTLGIGIIDENGKILADVRKVYSPPLGKGIIPNEAAKHHEKNKEIVLKEALNQVNLEIDEIDGIAYSAGPGLPPCLSSVSNFANKLAKKYKKKLIPVNHMLAHVEIGKLVTKARDPIVVYVSGGNTMILGLVENKYRVFGETLDIPLGNALDVVAREMGLPMPGGPQLDELAKKGKFVNLPYIVKGMDLSFSGIVTACIKKLKEGVKKEDIAFSLEEVCFSMLTEVTERALAHTGKNEVLLVGGVAASKILQEKMERMCKERGARVFYLPQEYARDNGVMIAWVGMLFLKSKKIPKIERRFRARWRIEEVEIPWV